MGKRVIARAAALFGATALSAAVLVGVAAPAQAASLGDVQLSQQSGSVNDIPMFASATTAKCPTGFGENVGLRVGREGGPYSNLGRPLGGGGFDQGPVTIEANRSFAAALGGTAPAAGDWWVIVECFSLTDGRNVDEFRTPVVVAGETWRVKSASNAADTTTTLAVDPAGPVEQGTSVALTASVAPAAAAGTVEFRRGSSVVGSAPVTGGTATVSTTALPVGASSLTAVFTPADTAAFKASTSAPVSVTVTAVAGAITAQQEIIADVAPGAFTLQVAGNTVQLAGGTVGGTAEGDLAAATVTDLRGGNAGWNLTGQLEDFASNPAGNTIGAEKLTWTPSGAKASGSGAVTAGAAADLGATRTLCSAAAGASAGVFTCGADLGLAIPDSVAPGEYAATLTLTLA